MINSYKKALDAITASEDSKQRAINEFVRLNSVKNKMVVKKESKPARKGLWKYLAAVSMVCLLVAGGIFGIVRGFGSSGITVLAAPLNIETETETKKLTWSEVENSIGYVLLFDNGEYIEVEDNYFSYEHFRGGVYSFRIMAKGNGTLFSNSDWSASKTFTVVEMLKSPQNVAITDSYLTWDAVEFASGYVVQIDTETVSLLSSQTSYSLASLEAGYYDVKVKAVGNGHTFLDSGFTVALNYMAVHQLETPTNLRYNSEERVITWDKVDNADEYGISITFIQWENNGTSYHKELLIWIDENSFSLNKLNSKYIDEWWDYEVKVFARSNLSIFSTSNSSELFFTPGIPGMHFKRVNNDEAYELVRCAQIVKGETIENVVIPAYYNGKPVIGIGSAFSESGLGKHPVKSVVIPDTVTYIGSNAFDGSKIERIIIPESVTRIGRAAFANSYLLEIVILNEQIIIEDFAFSQGGTLHPPLARVYFGGDETAWNALAISALGNSGLFDAQRFYYSETEILDGSHWRFVDGLPVVWGL